MMTQGLRKRAALYEEKMSAKITSRQNGGVTILDVSGKITLGDGSVTVREAVKGLIAAGTKQIVLDLGGVNYIDSSGIGELVAAHTSVSNNGGNLKLLNLTKRVQDLLQITKLYTVFEVFDSEAAAVGSF
jgi:anti-sigma B factor antagonist